MRNPWLEVSAEDYEGHMGHPQVAQLAFLSRVLRELLDEFRPRSLAVPGSAMGTGFEHIDPRLTSRVLAVDIHEEYLEILRKRHGDRLPGLRTLREDLSEFQYEGESFDLVFAALIFEYLDPEMLLPRLSAWLRPGGTLATAIEQAGDVVVVTDREGIIQYVNPAFETSSGYSRSEVLGQTPDFLDAGKYDDKFQKELWDTILGGEVWSGRFINKRKDGTLLHETATISPVFDREGEITHFVAVKHDITRQIELEEQVRHAHRMEAVGHLAGGLAHDFNNILQSMIGFLEFAREGLDEDDQRRLDLDEVQKGADRATKLTQELLTFSRLREAKLVPLDLRAAFGASLSMMRPMLGVDIYLEFEEPDEPLVAMVDHLLLDRVITNLCVNARDAMPEGGELRIELGRREIDETFAALHPELSPDPHVCFSIADSGRGIPIERLGHIFDPFYSTKDIGEGTGLGLAVVHGIVKQHGGLIEVESEMGKGTRFLVTLQEARAEEIREHELAEETHH